VAQQISCQSDKWLWSYELKQQLFCSLGKKIYIYNFFLTINFIFLKD
jgi:hypothetical protein